MTSYFCLCNKVISLEVHYVFLSNRLELVIDFLRNFHIRFSVLLNHHEIITENLDLKLEEVQPPT